MLQCVELTIALISSGLNLFISPLNRTSMTGLPLSFTTLNDHNYNHRVCRAGRRVLSQCPLERMDSDPLNQLR